MKITKSKLVKLLKVVITFVILFFVMWKLNIKLSSVFTNIIEYKYIIIDFVMPLIILPLISANRWKVFLKQTGINEKLLTLIKINWISIFQGIILPSSQGQDVLRIYHIEKRHPDKRGNAGSTIIIERMMGFVVLCLLSLFFSIFNTGLMNQKKVILIIGGITVSLFIVIGLLLNKRLHSYISKKKFSNKFLQKGFSYFDKLYKAIAYFPYRKVLFSSVVLILLFQLSTIVSVYLIFKAYGYNIPLYQHISLYPIVSILSMIPITISGLGIREGFFVYFYAQIGVPADVAIGVSLINYMIIVLTPALIGGILNLVAIFKKEKTI